MTLLKLFSLPLLLIVSLSLSAQSVQQELNWSSVKWITPDSQVYEIPSANEVDLGENGRLFWYLRVSIPNDSEIELVGDPFFDYGLYNWKEHETYLQTVGQNLVEQQLKIIYQTERNKKFALISKPAIIWKNDQYLKLAYLNFEYKIKSIPTIANKFPWKNESLLRSGKWAKVFVANDAIYSLSFEQLQSANLSLNQTPINNIRVFGYNGALLPEPNNLTKFDDLEEIPIKIKDNNANGIFDSGDLVLFFGRGPNRWQWSQSQYQHQNHHYSNVNAYFITTDHGQGLRVSTIPQQPLGATYVTNQTDQLFHHELNRKNLIKSGKRWYGEEFDRELEYNFTIPLHNHVSSEPVFLQTVAVARSLTATSLRASVNGMVVQNHNMSGVSMRYEGQYCSTPFQSRDSFFTNQGINLNYRFFRSNNTAQAWLDYFDIHYRSRLTLNGQLQFRDYKTIAQNSRFELNGNIPEEIWEITDEHQIKSIPFTNSQNTFTFEIEASNQLREFIAFSTGNYQQVSNIVPVQNQNLHAQRNIDYLMVVHPEFLEQAIELATFHEQDRGLKVLITTPEQIYNEFSSGIADISAIRNFARMLYETANPGNELRYLLLFGDASYDYKYFNKGNTNFVPTYQSDNSEHPTSSYCSDDYFGFLDPEEGSSIENESVDIGIGRFTVTNKAQADAMVNKIKRYKSTEGFGDWRNTVVILTDDEDNNTHFEDGELFSNLIEQHNKSINIRKVHADAYRQVAVGNGHRYPDVNREIDRAFNDGSLVVNYSGHGGEQQLGHEKFVDIPMINSWRGGAKLPLFITATCEFTRYDDPNFVSAGEWCFLNPNGGAIALLTTVRLVFAWPNRELNSNFYRDNAFNFEPGNPPALGDAYRVTKNKTSGSINKMCFVLIGDPALQLAHPKYKVTTTKVSSNPLTNSDTIRALSMVNVSGEVLNLNDELISDFEGELTATIFGSKQTFRTLGNDPTSIPKDFKDYRSILFRGKASVKGGQFAFSFITPIDIPLESGMAKISYYAHNNIHDASGYDFVPMISEVDPNAIPDFNGPTIRLFMNDSNFIAGSITNENPDVYAVVYDESGINTSGTGIGRDIIGILNDDTKNSLVLNEFYKARLDDFRSGEIRYPLQNLPEGQHKIFVRVWDVHNNSANAETFFVVSKSIKAAIESLIAYPNPFSNRVRFQFNHNQGGKEVTLSAHVFNGQGALIETLSNNLQLNGSVYNGLIWDTQSEGKIIQPGLYYVRITLRSENGDSVMETIPVILQQ